MRKRRTILLLSAGLLVLFAWLTWPIYQFYGHRGRVPLPPIGWEQIPNEVAPFEQGRVEPGFGEAADEALALMREKRAGINAPGLSGAVAVGGRVVWTGSAGWADVASGKAMTPETRFRIGSTSKALTGTLLARLKQKGTVKLDTPIVAYFDPLPNPDWHAITPRHLASHLAGLRHYGDNDDLLGYYHSGALTSDYDTVQASLAIFDGSSLLFEPGSAFSYSTFGTVLLSAVLSEAADEPYRALMRTEVFRPLGMDATAPEQDIEERSDFATFYYQPDSGKPQVRPWRTVNLSHRLAGGGFIATPADLTRLGIGWLDDGFIEPSTREAFWTPQRLANGEVNDQDYALGWRFHETEIEGVGAVHYANHGGVSRGSQAWLMVVPDHDLVLAMTMNANTEVFSDFADVAMPMAGLFISAAKL